MTSVFEFLLAFSVSIWVARLTKIRRLHARLAIGVVCWMLLPPLVHLALQSLGAFGDFLVGGPVVVALVIGVPLFAGHLKFRSGRASLEKNFDQQKRTSLKTRASRPS